MKQQEMQMNNAARMRRLYENGSTGLDMSPGDPVAHWAHKRIQKLEAALRNITTNSSGLLRRAATQALEDLQADDAKEVLPKREHHGIGPDAMFHG
jgi:hypothetical protein